MLVCLCARVSRREGMSVQVCVCIKEANLWNVTFNVKRIKIYMLKCLVLHFNRLVNAYAYMGIDAHFFIHNWYFESCFFLLARVIFLWVMPILNFYFFSILCINIRTNKKRAANQTKIYPTKHLRGQWYFVFAFVMCRTKQMKPKSEKPISKVLTISLEKNEHDWFMIENQPR